MYPFEKHEGEEGEIKGGKYIVAFYWEMLNNASALFFSFLPLSPSFLSFDFSFLSSLSSFSLPKRQLGRQQGVFLNSIH